MSKRLGTQLVRIKKREAMEVLGEMAVLVGYTKTLLNEIENLTEDAIQEPEQ